MARALRLYAGPAARRHIEREGLAPRDVAVVPGAAGGPKGLVLGPLDRFLFGQWLAASEQPIDLVGASIGGWRLATACLADPAAALAQLEHDYIRQRFEIEPGRRRPSADHVSERFAQDLARFYGGRLGQVLTHPRYRLHIVTARGRHVLGREHPVGTPLGYMGALCANAVHRKALGAWVERVVFSTLREGVPAPLPFGCGDFRTRQVALTEANFQPALQASCSIPFVLRAVHDIPGAPPGAYWDGGITDYQLHLDYSARAGRGLVLYPHYQRALVPGWLDKALRWRRRATRFLDTTLVLAPDPDWVRSLPNGKLPDRSDFVRYGDDLPARMRAWNQAAAESQRLADEFATWLEQPDPGRVESL